MLRLFGFPRSNYYRIVKLTLLERGLAFEEVQMKVDAAGKLEFASDYLRKSPMGKVPCLQTDHGFLSEANVIIDYLDGLGDGPSFYPEDPFDRAKVREIMKYIELYLELPARRLYGVFFHQAVPDGDKVEVRELLERGFSALGELARFDPYIAGREITYADFYALFALTSVTRTAKAVYGWDAFNTVEGVRGLLTLVGERKTVQSILGVPRGSDGRE